MRIIDVAEGKPPHPTIGADIDAVEALSDRILAATAVPALVPLAAIGLVATLPFAVSFRRRRFANQTG